MIFKEALTDFLIGGVPYYSRNRRDWIPAGVNCKFEKGLTYELEHWNTASSETIKAHSNIPVEALDFYGDHNTSQYHYYVTKSMIIPFSGSYMAKLDFDAKWVDANASLQAKAVAASQLAANLTAKAASAAGTPAPSGGLIGSPVGIKHSATYQKFSGGGFDQYHVDSCCIDQVIEPTEEEGSRYSKTRKCLLCGSPAYMGLNTFECSKGCK